jgi:hypothetical protein
MTLERLDGFGEQKEQPYREGQVALAGEILRPHPVAGHTVGIA